MAHHTHEGLSVLVSDTYYAFSARNEPQFRLVIHRGDRSNRQWGEVSHVETKKLPVSTSQFSAAALLGTIKSPNNQYVILALSSSVVGKIAGHEIHKAKATEVLPVSVDSSKTDDEYRRLLQSHLDSAPLYFSRTLDLTNAFERQTQANIQQQTQGDPMKPLWQRADDRFFWNRFAQDAFIKYQQQCPTDTAAQVSKFIQPVMFGMLEIKETSIRGVPFTYALITRRSRHRVGTRYFSRGIDKQGNVSNFNETEQIVVFNPPGVDQLKFPENADPVDSSGIPSITDSQILSYVQTRGSVPVYWQEINTLKYTPRLEVQDATSAQNAARIHFQEQSIIYGTNYLVNLVNEKGREAKVRTQYKELVNLLNDYSNNNDPKRLDLNYIEFDFHTKTKGMNWKGAKLLLDELEDGIRKSGYFHCSWSGLGDLKVHRSQTGVIRTNCMDCLDRTNVVQTMFSQHVLTDMLLNIGIQDGAGVNEPTFKSMFQNVWADNADVVSKAYSGTGALKTDFTRTGTRTRAGMVQDLVNSCTRYAKNNFFDGPRQDSYDLFVGGYSYPPLYPSIELSNQLADRRSLLVQGVPYVLGFSLLFITLALRKTREPTMMGWALTLAMVIFLVVGAACAQFIAKHGVLYVNWPRLNRQPWMKEIIEEATLSANQNPVIEFLTKAQEGRRKGVRRKTMQQSV